MKSFYKIAFSALIAFIFFSCSIAQDEKTIEKSFEGIDDIDANFASGDITLLKGTSGTVEIKLVYTFDEDRFTPEFEQNGSKLEIEEKFKRGPNTGYSKWTITLPDGIDLDVNSGSGDISAADLEINIDSNTGSGDMDLSNIRGQIDVNCGSGDVRIGDHSGEVSVNTGSGDISVSDSEVEIDLNAGSGDITISSVKGDLSVNTGSGDVTADRLTITGNSKFNSGSGDAKVTLASPLDHDISLNSGSGDAVLDFDGQEISGEITMKATKGRGEIEAPFEFDKVEEEQEGRQTRIVKTAKIGTKNIDIYISTGSGRAVIKK